MKLVCIGDSLTYGYNVAPSDGWIPQVEKELPVTIINRGLCGDTTTEMRGRFTMDVLEEKPDLVFIMGGANDVLLDVPVGVTEQNILFMIDMARGAGLPVILGIPPLTKPESSMYGWQAADDVDGHNAILTALREFIVATCREQGLPYIDFYTAMQEEGDGLYADGVHPNKQGYALFAKCAFAIMGKVIKQRSEP